MTTKLNCEHGNNKRRYCSTSMRTNQFDVVAAVIVIFNCNDAILIQQGIQFHQAGKMHNKHQQRAVADVAVVAAQTGNFHITICTCTFFYDNPN